MMIKRQVGMLALWLGAWLLGTHSTKVPAVEGLFDIYAANRAEAQPNYITADLWLLSYSLLRDRALKTMEARQASPLLGKLIAGLEAVLATQPQDEAGRANRDFLAVLAALYRGAERPHLPADKPRAAAELQRARQAGGLVSSPLWGAMLDYSQLRPRGHYSATVERRRYFQAMRYAGMVLFAIQPSQATGIRTSRADRMTEQALRLVQALQTAPLAAIYERLEKLLAWQFGLPDDLRTEDIRQVAAAQAGQPVAKLRAALLAHARAHDRQPRILGGVVDINQLEPGLSAVDVLTGWRLLPARYSVDAAVFQGLVHNRVGEYNGACAQTPFGLTSINGRPVKGFPLANELMALLGSAVAEQQLQHNCETAYQGYPKARTTARRELERSTGMAQGQFELLRVWLGGGTTAQAQQRLTTAKAFWTWQRYLAVLYSKQSYTPVGKSLQLPKERSGAWLEVTPDLYRALGQLVEAHRTHTPAKVWDDFAELLGRCLQMAKHAAQTGVITVEDEAFLNNLDRRLQTLIVRKDAPIVVDVHTNPASNQVLQEATGMAQRVLAANGKARGARLSHQEFKQPLADRLTPQQWRTRLAQAQEATSPQRTWTDEDRMLRFVEEEQGRLLLWPKQGYLYPVWLKERVVLESYPLKIKVYPPGQSEASIVVLERLRLPALVDTAGYQLQVQIKERWHDYVEFTWQGETLRGRAANSSIWGAVPLAKVRFQRSLVEKKP